MPVCTAVGAQRVVCSREQKMERLPWSLNVEAHMINDTTLEIKVVGATCAAVPARSC